MRRSLLALALACGVALTTAAAAQDPPRQPPQTQPPQTQPPPTTQPPRTTPPPASTSAQAVTVEGCVTREADVPGRKPNVAERAGISEDYILTMTKMVKGSAPAGGAQARPGDKPTGTTGTAAAMYEIEGIDDEKLKQHVGRRVQIDGTFENAQRPGAAAAVGDDLVQIRGTTIRQVAGECAAK
jgi:hypothetical protein